MDFASLDKIIGSSPIHRQSFTMHHSSGACAFVSGGIISIIKVNQLQKYDFQISDNTHEIDVISFSRTGRQLAVGTKGPQAKFYVITFNESFDQITDQIEKKTDENGFSSIDIDSDSGKLITVGVDSQPFIILWNLKQGKPEAIGRYRIKCVPNHISLSNDGQFAIVSGPCLLRIIDTSVDFSQKEIKLLKSRSIAMSKFRQSNFVAAYACSNSFARIYALTDDGTLLIYEKSCVDFTQQIKCNKISLGCGPTQCMVVDEKLALIGANTGSVMAVKCDAQQHTLFGQFSSDGYPVLSVCCSSRICGAAYNNGSITFYPRRPGKQPLLTIQQHRGPVCCLNVLPSNDEKFVVSGGSDGSVRVWEVIKHQELVSGSSQHMIAARKLVKASDDYLTSIKGIRCVGSSSNYIFAGDNYGNLHVLSPTKLDIISRIEESSRGTTSLAIFEADKIIATGGLDGMVRVYSFKKDGEFKNISIDPTHTAPVTAMCFCGGSLISCSKEGIRFAKLPTGEPYKTAAVEDLPLSICALPNKKYVATCGMDRAVSIWRVSDGTLFRKYPISMDEKTTCLAVDKSGLFIAVGLSSSVVTIIDTFSGDVILRFHSVCSIITSICFQQNDIIVAGMTGCIARWTLPEFIHKAVQDKTKTNTPLDLLIDDESEPEHSTIASEDIPKPQITRQASSTIKCEPNPEWTFVENKEEKPNDEETVEDDGTQPADATDEAAQLDADYIPRPVFGQKEQFVDDIIRASFIGRDEHSENENDLDSSGETDDTIMKMLDSIKNKKIEEDKDKIIIDDIKTPPRNQKMKISVDQKPIKGIEDADEDPFILDEFEKEKIEEPTKAADTPKPAEIPKAADTPVSYSSQIAGQLKLLLTTAEELLEMEAEDPSELEALGQLRDVMNEIERSALSSKWLKEELMNHMAKIFENI